MPVTTCPPCRLATANESCSSSIARSTPTSADLWRKDKRHWREVHDPFDACLHQPVRDRLGRSRRHDDHSQLDLVLGDDLVQVDPDDKPARPRSGRRLLCGSMSNAATIVKFCGRIPDSPRAPGQDCRCRPSRLSSRGPCPGCGESRQSARRSGSRFPDNRSARNKPGPCEPERR